MRTLPLSLERPRPQTRSNRALSGQDAKSGKFSYYVCQSIMKHGKDACEPPRLNARRFEELAVGKIRSNVLTDSNIRTLVKVVDEQMDSVVAEQRKRLETIEGELKDVKRILGRIWHFIETADNVEMTDASDRIRQHRDRQERLEDLAAEARAILSQRREVLDDGFDKGPASGQFALLQEVAHLLGVGRNGFHFVKEYRRHARRRLGALHHPHAGR